MAETLNFGAPLLAGGSQARLDTIVNSQATAFDTNIKAAMDAQTASFAGDIAAANNMLRGTAAQRAVTTSKFWQFWLDTDGSERIYVGNKTGGWRQYMGEGVVAAGAWNSTVSSMAGRTISSTLPTVLLPGETIQLTATSVGTGFGMLALTGVTRGVSNTPIQFRQMQLMAYSTNGCSFAWKVVMS